MALPESLRKDLSRLLKDGSTIYFSKRLNRVQVVMPIHHAQELRTHCLVYADCEITDIETAIDEAGLTQSTYNTDEGVTVLSVYKTRQEDTPEIPLEDTLSTLPWFLIVVSKETGEATIHYSYGNKPFSKSQQTTVKGDLEAVQQALKARGIQFREHTERLPFTDKLEGSLVFIRRDLLPMNA